LEAINVKFNATFNLWEGKKYKSNILKYKKDYDGYHPTQKPVLLLEDLIKTFSNEGNLVVDLTCGSGSTGVACVNTGRNFIGIEKDEKYFEIAKERITEAERHKNNESFAKKPDSPTSFDFMLEDKQ
jgi:site-specific DNA-methyltransferase (adenine-specific)